MATSKPSNTIRSGNIKATIWENRGKNGNFFQATFSRPFKDEKGTLAKFAVHLPTTVLRTILLLQRFAENRGAEVCLPSTDV